MIKSYLSGGNYANTHLSGILDGSGMPTVGCAAASLGAFTLGMPTAMSA